MTDHYAEAVRILAGETRMLPTIDHLRAVWNELITHREALANLRVVLAPPEPPVCPDTGLRIYNPEGRRELL